MSDSSPSQSILSDNDRASTNSADTLPDTPDDISRWQCHIDLQDFGESLQAAAKAVFPNKSRSRYTRVSVMLLSWEDEDPNLPVSIEINQLDDVFRNTYGFETEIWKIPDKNCHARVNQKILQFVTTNDDPAEHLFIVYYAGHAKLTKDRLLSWTSWRDQKLKCPNVQWSGIQNVLEQSESDIVIFLDCCHSGTASASEGNGITELISACAYNSRANGVGYYSFTKELITELRNLSSKPSFTVGELYRNIFCRIQGRRPDDGRERHPAPVHLSLTQDNPRFPRSIQLSVQPRVTGKIPIVQESGGNSETTDRGANLSTLANELSIPDEVDEIIPPNTRPTLTTEVPRILLAVRLKDDVFRGELSVDLFKEWLRNFPAYAEDVTIEAGFGSFSSILIVSLPLALSLYLPQDSAIIRIGPITTPNLVRELPAAQKAIGDHELHHPKPAPIGPQIRCEIAAPITSLTHHQAVWKVKYPWRYFETISKVEPCSECSESGKLCSNTSRTSYLVIIFRQMSEAWHNARTLDNWYSLLMKLYSLSIPLLRMAKHQFITVAQMSMLSQITKASISTISGQDILGLVALFISLVALATTVLQVLQQYFASMEFMKRCSESTLGLWAEATRRKFRFSEFRVEVVFETPMIFLARPRNTHGPIQGRPIFYIDGTKQSYKDTRVQQRSLIEYHNKAPNLVPTVDDERASWVTLLLALQAEESKSWIFESRNGVHSHPEPEYSLRVGLQRKTCSWDFIPSSITRPFATTAICYLIEMVAFLGMSWKSFDKQPWNLRAEGNGLVLTSTKVHNLRVMVVFSMTRKYRFQGSRVIPTSAIKELCFGTVPNIFDDLELNFGNQLELRETLKSLGCTDLFLSLGPWEKVSLTGDDDEYPTFDIIGMLGEVFRIRSSNFKMLPNPTWNKWSRDDARIHILLGSLKIRLQEYVSQRDIYGNKILAKSDSKHEINRIQHQCNEINITYGKPKPELTLATREIIHDAIDDRTEYLLRIGKENVTKVICFHLKNEDLPLSSPLSVKELMDSYFEKKIADEDLAIWISLVFRMLCWYLLHDFIKDDVNIVPSDLKGSTMPVFIE